MTDDFSRLDATGQAELVRRHEVTPLELVDAAIARIEHLNPTLNAVIHPRFEAARAEARAAVGPGSGPFHGVPFLVKDLLCSTAGDPMHMGTRFLRDVGFRAPHDSFLAQKLRAAGFIILGRTNTPELGTLPATEPDAYGPTRNPWNPEHSTGGSSGGSAAAVAAGLVPAAHANDGGGSIRIPASECGLVGLKPSRGRTSFGPDVGDGMGGMVCEGTVTRSVRDTAGILDAIAGHMPGDPYTAPPPGRPYGQEVGTAPGKLRVGMLLRPPANMGTVHAEVAAAVDATGGLLAELGHEVHVAHPDALDEPEVGQHFSTMYATHVAHLLETLSVFVGRPLGRDDVDPLNWSLAELGNACSANRYLASVDWIHGYTRRLAGWWEHGFDLLLTPTVPEPPPLLGAFRPDPEMPVVAGLRATMFAAFTAPFNMSGQPAISLPLHWSSGGLPMGMQLVAAFGHEDLLLRVAAQLESAQPWADRRPALHA
ncbi:MAG TPA: amidase [Candidatus Binatia bacterium]|jgi:amidase|nr:amidase [Candidatus Binatia bacterium]